MARALFSATSPSFICAARTTLARWFTGNEAGAAREQSCVCWRREIVRAVDMSSPHQWYSVARAIQRRIVYHTGPTNSGKTYEALQVRRCHQPLLAEGPQAGPITI